MLGVSGYVIVRHTSNGSVSRFMSRLLNNAKENISVQRRLAKRNGRARYVNLARQLALEDGFLPKDYKKYPVDYAVYWREDETVEVEITFNQDMALYVLPKDMNRRVLLADTKAEQRARDWERLSPSTSEYRKVVKNIRKHLHTSTNLGIRPSEGGRFAYEIKRYRHDQCRYLVIVHGLYLYSDRAISISYLVRQAGSKFFFTKKKSPV